MRVFHWALVVAVVAAVACAKAGLMDWHMRAGLLALGLVVFRVIWGFAGTRWARFASFVRGPVATFRYARSWFAPPPAISVGHNPLGGWGVVLLLACIGLQAFTGLFTNDEILTEGPLAKYVSADTSSLARWVHNLNEQVIYVLVGLHVLAVIWHRLRFGERLVGPMISGIKRLPARFGADAIGATPTGRALAIAALVVLGVWLLSRA